MIRETPIPLIPVGAETRTCGHIPRGKHFPRWHKQGGISRAVLDEPKTEILERPGLKVIVLDYGDRLELRKLEVAPECQGRGVGSGILKQLKTRGKEIAVYPYSVEGRDADLERFYRRAGFRPSYPESETFVWKP